MTMMKKTSITKKSVLIECLEIMRQELAVFSKHYDGLEPARGMEEAWEQGRRKVEILKDLCQSMDSPLVEEAMAGMYRVNVTPDGYEIREPANTTNQN